MLAATVVATLFTSSAARAEMPRVSIDWERLLGELDAYARGRSERGASTSTYAATMSAQGRQTQPLVLSDGSAWFGVAPSVSFVARDWSSAYRLSGDRLSLVDALRLSESTRMILTRVRLSGNSRVTPFLQVGAGQWRTDSRILPLTPSDTEIAAQVGAGFELQLAPNWQVACETSATLFIRDARETNDIPDTRMWNAMVASRIQL